MKRQVSFTVVLLLIVAEAAWAQKPPAPSPELKKLGVFVGSWTGDGKLMTTPFSPGGIMHSTMTCNWYHGGYHLVCDAEDSGPAGKNFGHSIHGYDAEKKQFFTYGIESSGFAGPGGATVDGSTWMFDAKTTMTGKPFWYRTNMRFASPTQLSWKSEYSEDGKAWKPLGEGKLAKKP